MKLPSNDTVCLALDEWVVICSFFPIKQLTFALQKIIVLVFDFFLGYILHFELPISNFGDVIFYFTLFLSSSFLF